MKLLQIPGMIARTKPMQFVARHSNVLLASAACIGVIGTTAAAIDGTRRAIPLLEELRDEYGDIKEVPKGELIKTMGRPYIPMLVSGGFTLAFIVVGAHMNAKKIATLTSLYTGSQIALGEYKNAMEERFGKDKVAEVKDALVKEKLDKSKVDRPPMPESSELRLFYDADNDRYLYTTRTRLERAVDEFNHGVDIFTARTLNEFYTMPEMDPLGPVVGGDMLMITTDNKLRLYFGSYLVNGTDAVNTFAIDSVLVSSDGSKKCWPKHNRSL